MLEETADRYTDQEEDDVLEVARAQLGCEREWVDEYNWRPNPFNENRMRPRTADVSPGRANSASAAVFYCSNIEKTALAEVRPWKGAHVTVARFRVRRKQPLLNLDKCEPPGIFAGLAHGRLTHEQMIQTAWSDINRAFSRPVSPGEAKDEYLPTQIISEFFRNAGYSGIIHKSAVCSEGHNLILYDINLPEFMDSAVYRVDDITYNYSMADDL
jgi:hypothetical protein